MKIYKITDYSETFVDEVITSEIYFIKTALTYSESNLLVNRKFFYYTYDGFVYKLTNMSVAGFKLLQDIVTYKIDTETPDITAFEFFKGNVKTVQALYNGNYQVEFEKSKAILYFKQDDILDYFNEYCKCVLGLSSSIDLRTFNSIHCKELPILSFEIKENYTLQLVYKLRNATWTVELSFISEAKLYSCLEYVLPCGCYTTIFQYGIAKASLCDLNVLSCQVKSFNRQGNKVKLNYYNGTFSHIEFKDLINLECCIENNLNKVRIYGQFNLEFELEFDKFAKNELNYFPSLDTWAINENVIEYKLKNNDIIRVEYVDLDLLDKQIKSLKSVYKKPTITISSFTPDNMIKEKFTGNPNAFTQLVDEIVSTTEGNAEFLKAKEWVKLTFYSGKDYSNFESLAMAFKEGTIDYKEFESKVAELITVKKKSYTTITLPSDISMLTQLLRYYEIHLGEAICSDGKTTTYVFDSPNAESDGTYELTINGLVKLTIPLYTSAQST